MWSNGNRLDRLGSDNGKMSELAKKMIGSRLDEVRKREGLSQGEFCKALGISRTSLQNYVRGGRDIPTSILARLLELYSVDPSWMIQGDISETALRNKSEILAQIRAIGLAVENRAAEREIALSPEERWRVTSQLYTVAVVQTGKADIERSTSNFVLDQVFESNGY